MIPLFHRMDRHIQELVQGTSIAFMLKVLGTGFAFCFNVLLGRTLGAEGAGIYFLSWTISASAVVLGSLGLNDTIVRFTAAQAAIGDWASAKGVCQVSAKIGICGSILTALLILAIAPSLARDVFSKPELSGTIRLMALSVPPLVMLIFYSQMLKGLKRIFYSQLLQGVSIPALSLFGLYLVGNTWGAYGPIWAYIFATYSSVTVALWLWHRVTPQFRNVTAHFQVRDLLNSSIPLFWVALMNLAMERTGTVMLAILCSKADVGMFAIAFRTAALTSFILIAVNSIAAPKIAGIYKQGDVETLRTMMSFSTIMMTLIATPMLLLFLFAPGWVMSLFGPQFAKSAAALSILSVGQFVNTASGSAGYLLRMTGHEAIVRNNFFFGAVLNVLLNIFLVPKYGIIGAAIATASALACKNIMAIFLVNKYLSIKMWSIDIKRLYSWKLKNRLP